jgi:hypothetical protein
MITKERKLSAQGFLLRRVQAGVTPPACRGKPQKNIVAIQFTKPPAYMQQKTT